MAPELSREDQLRAELIYNRAQYVGWALWFVALIAASVIHGLLSRIYPSLRGNGGGMGGLAMWPAFFMPRFAAWRVRRAGLSRERVERRTIPKTLTAFRGEPFVLRAQNSAALGWFGLVFSLTMVALLAWIQTGNQPYAPVFALFGFLIFGAMCVGSIYLATKPLVLRLDSLGVKGWLSDFRPRRMPWKDVAAMEIQQAFNFRGQPGMKTVLFLDSSGKPLIKALLTPLTIKPEKVEELLAQIEARLNAE